MYVSTAKNKLRLSTAICGLGLIMAAPAFAEGDEDCRDALDPQPAECERANSDIVVRMPIGENTEGVTPIPGPEFQDAGFSISIDNETVAGATVPVDPRRANDIKAEAADVDVRFDGLSAERLLNVATVDLRGAYRAGEAVRFRTSSNYPAYILSAEVLVRDTKARGRPIVARLVTKANGTVDWAMPADGSGHYTYILRVYGQNGRFDETAPLALTRTAKAFDTHETVGGAIIAAGEGEDRTARRGIRVHGGQITVAGTGVQPGETVTVMGEAVPVDATGRFVMPRILPAGDQIVTVQISDGTNITRDVEIPASDWFGVGLIDVTFGKRLEDDLADGDPDYEDTYVDSRMAFYARGRTKNGVTIATSLDSGEGPIDETFQRLDEKDPRKVIARLDPEDLYPTYGDDSTSYDDTPTSGRFYFRAERDGNSFVWGDFKAGLTGSDLITNTRALYGAEVRLESASVTENGDARAAATLYLASPETLPQRDVLRGTGGSVYFLSHQDINGGSETLVIQVVDPVSGRVVDSTPLVAGVDYDFDYIQGMVMLAQPLATTSTGSGLIGGAVGDYDNALVVQYEYTPTSTDIDGASVGGRAEAWVGNNLRLGITAMEETTDTTDQQMASVDARVVIGKASHIELELAGTQGPGFGNSTSTDGGLTITDSGVVGGPRAGAFRFNSHLEFDDLGLGAAGHVGAWYEEKEAGFASLSENITEDQTDAGFYAEVDAGDRLTLGVEVESFEKAGGDAEAKAEVRAEVQVTDTVSIAVAAARLDRTTIGDAGDTGTRDDVGLRVTYAPSDDVSVFVFGQHTTAITGGLQEDDRFGAGFDVQLTEKVSVAASASDGDLGPAGSFRIGYAPTADNELYLGYTLDPTRTGAGYDLVGQDDGTFVFGGSYRYSDKFRTYAEDIWDMYGQRQSITQAYGASFTPDARWTVSGGYETGQVRDDINGDFDRNAVSLGVAYADEDSLRARGRLEYRTEDALGEAQDRDTLALSLGLENRTSENWRLLANLDALVSESEESDFRNGEYVEASLGYAYRPAQGDRTNLLFKYTYLHDLPGEDQVTADGTTDGPQQKSHILSVDGNYDIAPSLTFGAKYGYRKSELADRGTDLFTSNTAHLGILRLDWHIVHKWDLMLEGRVLLSDETDIEETGGLIGIYRHMGNNAKIGLGYEQGTVSDNPADIDYDSKGVFLNIIGKF
jgi:hypothetical protein